MYIHKYIPAASRSRMHRSLHICIPLYIYIYIHTRLSCDTYVSLSIIIDIVVATNGLLRIYAMRDRFMLGIRLYGLNLIAVQVALLVTLRTLIWLGLSLPNLSKILQVANCLITGDHLI